MSFETQKENNDTMVSDPQVVNPTSTNHTPKVDADEEFNLDMIMQTMADVSSGQIVDGTVVSVSEKDVLVDIGCKSESAIPIEEFEPESIPVKGDVIKVFVVSQKSKDGKTYLSKKKADIYSNVKKLKEAYTNNEVITGKVIRKVNGGLIVEVMGVEVFLPGSQLDVKLQVNYDQFLNKEIPLKVIKLDEHRNSIMVSRKVVMEEDSTSRKERLMEFVKVGAELDGEVKTLTEYGAFVDIGGIDGLLHITDMSYKKIKHPRELLKVGDKIKVKVINFDVDNMKISLGIKQLVPHPWENVVTKYPEGVKVTGKVINIKVFGIFVELEPGVEGLIHLSEISWTKKMVDPSTMYKVGDSISAIVLSVSKEDQKISLGLKQMTPNPWIDIEKHYPIGAVMTKKITKIFSYGVFVDIDNDISGLVHISDINWMAKVAHPRDLYTEGQEIECVILEIDKIGRRINLGIKQLTDDPWDKICEVLHINAEVVGTVKKCMPKGIVVDIPFEDIVVEGFVPISHLAIPAIEKTSDFFSIGEKLNMKIIEIEDDRRKIILSIKAWFYSRDIQMMKEFQKNHLQKANSEKEDEIPNDKKQAKSRRRRGRRNKHSDEDTTDIAPEDTTTPMENVPAEAAPQTEAEHSIAPAPMIENITQNEPAPEVQETPAEVEKPKKTTKKAATTDSEEEKPKKTTKKAATTEGEEKPKKTTKKAATADSGEEKPKKTTKKAAATEGEEKPKRTTKKATKSEGEEKPADVATDTENAPAVATEEDKKD
ncbi:MAG: 30S ribosomal protein S1 [Candidatus Cloacimonetes bacterium]|nr:30S ribosomal protein S1 [Candidatus Cloacimonadota bacterium]